MVVFFRFYHAELNFRMKVTGINKQNNVINYDENALQPPMLHLPVDSPHGSFSLAGYIKMLCGGSI